MTTERRYNIIIDESQRALIARALLETYGLRIPTWNLSEEDEPHALRHHFEDLAVNGVPEDCVQGLCL